MINQPIIDRFFRNRIPFQDFSRKNATRLVKQPKFTELGPLFMAREDRFTDLMAGGVVELKGVNSQGAKLETMISTMRFTIYTEDLVDEIEGTVPLITNMTDDLKLIGALGECLIQVCSRHTAALSTADDTGMGSVQSFIVAQAARHAPADTEGMFSLT